MAVVVSTSMFAFLCVVFGRYEKRVNWLAIAFIIVTYIACIHYNYGNDYKAYYQCWSIIKSNNLTDLLNSGRLYFGNDTPEIGWIILNKAFGFNYGFYYLIAFVSVTENLIYYRLIKKFVPRKSQLWSFFLYVFTYSFYLLNFSMIRQGYAIALVLLAFIFFCENKYGATIIVLAVAISLHISSVVTIPAFLLCKFKEKANIRMYGVMIIATTVTMFIASGLMRNLFNFIISQSLFSRYNAYYAGHPSNDSAGLGFLLLMMPYIVTSYYLFCKAKWISREMKFLIIFFYITPLIKPFEGTNAALVERLEFYFTAFNIVAVPIIYSRIKSSFIRFALFGSLITVALYVYIQFFNNDVYRNAYAEFHSIFELIG